MSSESRPSSARTGMSVDEIRRGFLDNLFYILGRFPAIAGKDDLYIALAHTVRDRMLERFISTFENIYGKSNQRIVCYLSAEFLLGPHLENNLINLGIRSQTDQAMKELDYNLDQLINQEEEPGLGNGGLGRLAACFLDSLATLDIPAIGYGIRYEYGIFDQRIKDGWQEEITDKWLRVGNPWEIQRPARCVDVAFGGSTEAWTDEKGAYRVRWNPGYRLRGVPYDTAILGYRTTTANLLRLWRSEAIESFDLAAFNTGDYFKAVEQKVSSENLTKILYPNDAELRGKQLRLAQQYFFVSCSLQDIIRAARRKHLPLDRLHEGYTVQLNDTHPSIAVAEMMRLLIDENDIAWDTAWSVTNQMFAYTNHTLLPEALERWPLPLFQQLLPRHLEIIYEINRRFLDQVRQRFPNDPGKVSRMSLIDEAHPKYVRMANLATVGSHTINGVAELHSELLKQTVLADFYEMWPERFTNVTNGVTPRRWMLQSNPSLAGLISSRIGDQWPKNLQQLRKLEPLAKDPDFRKLWRAAKHKGKSLLTNYIAETLHQQVNPDSMFDVIVKRIHEYKRQHLKVLHILALYYRLKANPSRDIVPRTFLFGGKAAPGYYMAKRIIKLIHSVGDVVNNDPDVAGRLKVIFLPDYNVTLGQRVYPAADLSEQISTAGKEASGTGNMKFSLNGALTIGTLDGANVEIRSEVGEENFFLFGLTADQVTQTKNRGYHPRDLYQADPELKQIIDGLASGAFSPEDPNLFRSITDSLLYEDTYLLFADFRSYLDCQDRVDEAWRDQERWTEMSILNTARMGKFSSDRSITEYAEKIWHTAPVHHPGAITL